MRRSESAFGMPRIFRLCQKLLALLSTSAPGIVDTKHAQVSSLFEGCIRLLAAAGYSPLTEASPPDGDPQQASAAESQAVPRLLPSWRWWAARALLARQRLLSGRAASIQTALQALLPRVAGRYGDAEGDCWRASSGVSRCARQAMIGNLGAELDYVWESIIPVQACTGSMSEFK